MPSNKRRTTLRWIFLLTFFLLLFQFIVAFTFTEPYPALLLPGFGNVPPEKEEYISRKVEFFVTTEDGKTISIDRRELFKNLRNVHSYILTRRLFNEHSLLFKNTENDTERKLTIGPYTYSISKERVQGEELKNEFDRWLIDRIHHTTGTQDITEFRIQWIQNQQNIKTGSDSTFVENTLTINLKK